MERWKLERNDGRVCLENRRPLLQAGGPHCVPDCHRQPKKATLPRGNLIIWGVSADCRCEVAAVAGVRERRSGVSSQQGIAKWKARLPTS